MAVLTCAQCRRTIEPGDHMLLVVVGQPERWQDAASRVEDAPKRWHYQCAPQAVRRYAAAPPRRIEIRQLAVAMLAGVVVLALVNSPRVGVEHVVDLAEAPLDGWYE